jgi:hypothetical protein
MKKIKFLVVVIATMFATQSCAQNNIVSPQIQNQSVGLRVANVQQAAMQYNAATQYNAVYSDVAPRDGVMDYDQTSGRARKEFWVVAMIDQNGRVQDVMVSFTALRMISRSDNGATQFIGKFSNVPFGANGVLPNGALDVNSGAIYYIIQ